MSSKYRLWMDNGDYEVTPLNHEEVAGEVEAEMFSAIGAALVTREDFSKLDCLNALDHIRFLINHSGIE